MPFSLPIRKWGWQTQVYHDDIKIFHICIAIIYMVDGRRNFSMVFEREYLPHLTRLERRLPLPSSHSPAPLLSHRRKNLEIQTLRRAFLHISPSFLTDGKI